MSLVSFETQLRQELAVCYKMLDRSKQDTERLDLLVKILERHELDRCSRGYTFFPKSAKTQSLVPAFYPNVRDLLDAVKEYK